MTRPTPVSCASCRQEESMTKYGQQIQGKSTSKQATRQPVDDSTLAGHVPSPGNPYRSVNCEIMDKLKRKHSASPASCVQHRLLAYPLPPSSGPSQRIHGGCSCHCAAGPAPKDSKCKVAEWAHRVALVTLANGYSDVH